MCLEWRRLTLSSSSISYYWWLKAAAAYDLMDKAPWKCLKRIKVRIGKTLTTLRSLPGAPASRRQRKWGFHKEKDMGREAQLLGDPCFSSQKIRFLLMQYIAAAWQQKRKPARKKYVVVVTSLNKHWKRQKRDENAIWSIHKQDCCFSHPGTRPRAEQTDAMADKQTDEQLLTCHPSSDNKASCFALISPFTHIWIYKMVFSLQEQKALPHPEASPLPVPINLIHTMSLLPPSEAGPVVGVGTRSHLHTVQQKKGPRTSP